MAVETVAMRVATDDAPIKVCPTFHYRLLDCEIDKLDWGLYVAWNDWVEVGRLAADEGRLQVLFVGVVMNS